VQTSSDLRIGSLVRWFGSDNFQNNEDIDDVGIVTEIHQESYDPSGISIYWSVTDKINFFNDSEIDECFYENRLELVSHANSSRS
jgi:hypothetical protein